tara:strand:+ start:1595 stop:2065 length:471 start_codon:yes stop_codon:yes gene_type:complete
MDKSFEDYLNDTNIVNIMNKVASGYRKAIDLDEIESIKMLTLWKCVDKYDPERGAKFTSYLYQQLHWALKNKLKKKKIEYGCDNIEKADNGAKLAMEARDVMLGLDPEVQNILSQRFFHNMTMVEIAKANGYSRETARRRLKTAIKICKKSNAIDC